MTATSARHLVIGTAGHVDHGKTTLVRALTGVDTDRLPEEKKRGITIELGFAPLALGDGVAASVVDVPGHKKLVHTMIAGAIGIELVLLVVAADEGVMPQTREHLAVCELLGIDRAVVALTKTDRASPELVELATEEIASLLEGRFTHRTVPVSARTGEGVDDLRAALRAAVLDAPEAHARAGEHAALAVDRAFSIQGAGAVVTGTLVRGAVKPGDAVRVVSADAVHDAVVRGLHVHGQAVGEAHAPTRLALNLGQIDRRDLHRGDLVTTDPGAGATRSFDATFRAFRPEKRSAEVEVHVGTARASGRVALLGEREGGARLVRVDLASPVPVLGGDRFVVRGTSSKGPAGAVVGGGRVLDARATRTKRREAREARVTTLTALDAGDAAAAIRSLAAEHAPRPVEKRDLVARYAIVATALARAAEKIADTGALVRIKDDGWVDRRAVIDLAARATDLVRAHHAAHPLDRGLKLETLRQKLGARAGAGVADEAIRSAAKQGATKRSAAKEGAGIVVESDVARLSDFVDGSSPRSSRALATVSEALAAAALKGLGDFAIGELLGDDAKQRKAILAKLAREGAAIAAGGQWFDAREVDALRTRVVAHYAHNAVMTIAAFKELSGLGRKQAIPLLELFDREGVTRREGDDRLPGPRVAPR